MKIVSREEFLLLPKNIPFSKYEPHMIQEMMIKGETITDSDGVGIDFFCQQIGDAVDHFDSNELFAVLLAAQEKGKEFGMDFWCEMRDGLFEDEMFVVWDTQSIDELIDRLQTCKGYDDE